NGYFIEVNEAWLNTLGFNRAEVIGKWFGDFLAPEFVDAFRKRFPIFKAQGHIHSEFVMIHRNGQRKFIAFDGRVGYKNDGSFKQTHCILQDISDRKLAEEELKESEEKYHSIYDNSYLGILLTVPDGRILAANGFACNMFGYSEEELCRGGRTAIVDTSDPRLIPILEERKRTGKAKGELTFIRKNGSKFEGEVSSSVFKDKEGNEKTCMLIQDLTEKRQTEHRYQTLFNEMMDGFALHEIICNENGEPVDYRFLDVNPAFEKMTGLKSEQIIGRTVLEIMPGTESFWIERYGKVALTGEPSSFESESKEIGKIFDVKSYCPAPNQFVTIFSDITKRKNSEEQLKISEEKYRSIFENVQDIYYEASFDGIILDVSPSIEIISKGQIHRGELIGKSIYDFYVNTEDRKTLVNTLMEAGSISDYEVTLLNKDGSHIPCSISSKLLYDGNGLPVKIFGSMHDITDRKHAAEKVLLNAERLARMVNIYQYNANNIQDFLDYALNEAIALTSSKIGYIYFYDEVKSEFTLNSWSRDVMKECAVADPQTRTALIDTGIWGEAVRQRKVIMINNFKEPIPLKKGYPKGHVHLERFLTIPIFDEDKIAAVVGVANKESDYDNTDVSQLTIMMSSVWRIVQKKEVEKKVKLLAHSLESVSECVSITDNDDVLMYVNEAFLKTYGYSENELIGKHVSILRPKGAEQESFLNILNLTLEGGWRGELLNIKKDGTVFPVLLSTSIIKDENKNPIALIGVAIDITELKKNAEELIAAKEKAEENDRLKTAFLHNISHEVRTPMNSIVGFSDLLADPDTLPEERKHFAEIIIQNSNQLLSIINDIVNIATIEAGQERAIINPVNINSICNLVYEQFLLKAKNKNIVLIFNNFISSVESDVMTDGTKLTQILTNLINNALKFTEEGYIELGYSVEGDNLKFFVKDTGIGIPPEKHEEIFKRFSQLNLAKNYQYGGSGLGLSISKAYVELLGGKIWIHSSPGKGSTFYFTIPYTKIG
ncbi:MAG: PAS domain S-box protein, partial [Bacteroidales bacterium]|nr:PAS domain S-box protein [Bacteroidales bacterium]